MMLCCSDAADDDGDILLDPPLLSPPPPYGVCDDVGVANDVRVGDVKCIFGNDDVFDDDDDEI